jgi:hypothetical protein
MIINFKSLLSISYNRDLDIEFTCGELEFTLLIDLKRNIYKFTKFILKYNIEGCKPVSNNQQVTNNQDNVANEENQGNSFLKYVIPAGLGVGVIATPFLLGALGGKNKKLKAKKLKTIKRKRKNKTKKRKKSFYR